MLKPDLVALSQKKTLVIKFADADSGEHGSEFKRERSRTQRRGDVTDDLLRIRHMLDAERHPRLADDRDRQP